MSSSPSFTVPKKRINNQDELYAFLSSSTYKTLTDFVDKLAESVKGYPILPNQKPETENVEKLCALLRQLKGWVDEIPPIAQPSRFGNRAFQVWCDRLQEQAPSLVESLLDEEKKDARDELVPYLLDSFGNRTRIDYGTGHEAHMLAFLFCLFAIGVFEEKVKQQREVVLHAFVEYISLMRKIQKTYLLEPAGSRGVWGLDDFHFLPFIFGAAQLQCQEEISTSQVLDDRVVRDFANTYMYVDAVRVIKETKAGVPFGESSPILHDITSVPNWKKIRQGLMKMYHGEVWSKFPVTQHFLFGSLLPFPLQEGETAPPAPPEFARTTEAGMSAGGFGRPPPPVAPGMPTVFPSAALNFPTAMPSAGAAGFSSLHGMPVTKAPWASGGGAGVPVTAAPWVSGGGGGRGPIPPSLNGHGSAVRGPSNPLAGGGPPNSTGPGTLPPPVMQPDPIPETEGER
uniref:Serine/threonine-protein phosphatase 2A activator n=1 Tax=Chromera velia CCMP2878 TaxID=1169474 RepID=A0A0G4HWV2_9ALVE|mmetsp:Transcript_34654/g.68456  ORF Transcript_34654/g.68456 Transcript_34654/m.68456 type:complete len:456 (+) Transcript_34654:160-1527(+)|eukprot:Cvel_9110.t1-p1 / transcript=Cvel_9110.t1 / gene=Cvel_9110 / organism=Chromera_velia_CCMP2878 / gene_product=Serine/threonine-protein phosphatase 2A activator, putative / transcript_product=Serine/threonine-protein phosphatase 2A activator, putative / location=Cvel_scaffold517:41023-45870(+) / protein_length=455 / sequence_SO=supercontig / SO=protein_coding / is_pseudo=false